MQAKNIQVESFEQAVKKSQEDKKAVENLQSQKSNKIKNNKKERNSQLKKEA